MKFRTLWAVHREQLVFGYPAKLLNENFLKYLMCTTASTIQGGYQKLKNRFKLKVNLVYICFLERYNTLKDI